MPQPYENSLGWLALQLRAQNLQRQQVQAERDNQQRAANEQASAQQAMGMMDHELQRADQRFNQDLEMAKLAGQVAQGKGEKPSLKNPKLQEAAELSGAKFFQDWKMKKEMDELNFNQMLQRDGVLEEGRVNRADAREKASKERAMLRFASNNWNDGDVKEAARFAARADGSEAPVTTSEMMQVISGTAAPELEADIEDRMLRGWAKVNANKLAGATASAPKTTINTGDLAPGPKAKEQNAVITFEKARGGFQRINELLAQSGDLFGVGGGLKSLQSNGAQQWASLQSFFKDSQVAPPAWSDDFETRRQNLRTAVGGLTAELIKDLSGLAQTNPEFVRSLTSMTGIQADLDNPQIDFSRGLMVRFQAAMKEYEDLLARRADVSRTALQDGLPLAPAAGPPKSKASSAPSAQMSPEEQAELDALRAEQDPAKQ